MCLELFIVPARAGRVSPERLSEVSGLRVAKRNHPTKNALHFSVDGGCSCSLMTDNADWNAPTWDLDANTLDGLARALAAVANEAEGFTLQAIWIGEKPQSCERIPLRDVLADVLNNRVKNKHIYVVGKAVAPGGAGT